MSAARSLISCAIAARSVDHRSCRAWMRALRLEMSNTIVRAERVSWSSETREQTPEFNNSLALDCRAPFAEYPANTYALLALVPFAMACAKCSCLELFRSAMGVVNLRKQAEKA